MYKIDRNLPLIECSANTAKKLLMTQYTPSEHTLPNKKQQFVRGRKNLPGNRHLTTP